MKNSFIMKLTVHSNDVHFCKCYEKTPNPFLPAQWKYLRKELDLVASINDLVNSR